MNRTQRATLCLCIITTLIIQCSSTLGAENATSAFQLASDGKALTQITIAKTASKRTKDAADELADYLQRISGAKFSITTGDGLSGIVLGTCKDFPAMAEGLLNPAEPFRRDEYLLQSHATGIRLLGATDYAVEHAVWDLLGRFGYRLFFLTDTWEIVPNVPDLRIAVDTLEKPDYITREAPRGAPYSSGKLWLRWKKRNRLSSAFFLHTGHSYGGIIARHKDVFKAHPEYLGLIDGKRGGSKFCISNPDLRKLVVDDAVAQIQKKPDRDSVSLDPSDGGGWCTCEVCVAMGSVTDRVVLLANQVAEAINQLGLGSKYVGIYGYASHSIPPNVTVHPNVIVSLATAFIKGGLTIDIMIKGWSAKGARIGIRDYHDVFTWSHDLPRKARGGNVAYLQRTIPHFYRNNARFMNSEATDSWAPNGLGFWISPILLWDIEKAEHIDELFTDFLDKAFGTAQEPMRGFYGLINLQDTPTITTADTIGRMYRFLQQAGELTKNKQVLERLDDLILYTRYIELYYEYRQASSMYPDQLKAEENGRQKGINGAGSLEVPDLSPRQNAYNRLSIHVSRMKDRYMISTFYITTRERYRDGSIIGYDNFAVDTKVPVENLDDIDSLELDEPVAAIDPRTVPFTQEEILTICKNGITANKLVVLDFKPVEFSPDLVAAQPLTITSKQGTYVLGDKGSRLGSRGKMSYYIWLDEPAAIEIGVTGGMIAWYRDRGNVKVKLFSPLEEKGDPVAQDSSVVPDGKEYRIVLRSRFKGLHILEINDGHDKSRLRLPAGIPITVASGINDRPPGWPGYRSTAYFYVPRGTTTIGGLTRELSGRILDGTGKAVFVFTDMKAKGFFSLPVPEGQDGTYWQFDNCKGTRHLMTVPPYLAKQPELLLIPREVVDKDFTTMTNKKKELKGQVTTP